MFAAVCRPALTATAPRAAVLPAAPLKRTVPALLLVPVTPTVNPFQNSGLRLFQFSDEKALAKRTVPCGSPEPLSW